MELKETEIFGALRFTRNGTPSRAVYGDDLEELNDVVRRYGVNGAYAERFMTAAAEHIELIT